MNTLDKDFRPFELEERQDIFVFEFPLAFLQGPWVIKWLESGIQTLIAKSLLSHELKISRLGLIEVKETKNDLGVEIGRMTFEVRYVEEKEKG